MCDNLTCFSINYCAVLLCCHFIIWFCGQLDAGDLIHKIQYKLLHVLIVQDHLITAILTISDFCGNPFA